MVEDVLVRVKKDSGGNANREVLILVVVEDVLVLWQLSLLYYGRCVLILVVVEDVLVLLEVR